MLAPLEQRFPFLVPVTQSGVFVLTLTHLSQLINNSSSSLWFESGVLGLGQKPRKVHHLWIPLVQHLENAALERSVFYTLDA